MTNTTLRSYRFTRGSVAGLAALTLAAVTVAGAPAAAESFDVRLIGVHDVPAGLAVDGTVVGGLSGIDRHPVTGEYLMISDDRSTIGPARYYAADIEVSATGIDSVDFTSATELTQSDGTPYPPYRESLENPCTDAQEVCDRTGSVDPEELRIDPHTRQVWWTTEGAFSGRTLINPAMRVAVHGRSLHEVNLGPDFRFYRDGQRGLRPNFTIEAFEFINGGARVVTAVEGPMVQDGPLPTPDQGALTRVTEHARSGRTLVQYAYPLDPIFAPPTGQGFMDNGITAILSTGEPGHYLVLERAFSEGHGYSVRMYHIDTNGAQDVSGIPSLAEAPGVQPLGKTLVADFGELGIDPLYNVEGMVWGPELPGGERSLVLVVDDNFSAEERTQVLALGLSESAA
ncbi:esterase-like activity of phytase family protein [Allonocardiopsis opalescens]|uniref:3-phytase n=1 Tax=Allonocardiopsis opalescens TaxID=1144618 RepID=A0A2T0QEH3_9ACTN|nr:esterase-like activity of phytase family protein [Allonocardiopsis opalescens]PRY02302.1 3-phytase [Allonocardiopsis opalescens]